MTTTYYRDWQITGPIRPNSITGKPAAYTIWEARDLCGGRRYSEHPFVHVDRAGIIEHIDRAAEYDDEPAMPVAWNLRQRYFPDGAASR